MGYQIYKLQNVSAYSDEKPDIVVTEDDPDWEQFLQAWEKGKFPTNSSFWTKGVFAVTKEITSS